MRLSDLYLLYAEAINEAEGPDGQHSSEMFKYIDMVRERAGLKGVKESWDTYTNNQKYTTKEGMRDIIQKERLIELSFEGHRFWDIRRWKTAPKEYYTPLQGWNMLVSVIDGTEEEVNRLMYQPQLLLEQKFNVRDYFWPIRISDIEVNPNLVQNIGW
jgi:SusD family.